jgi:hypothetical protein
VSVALVIQHAKRMHRIISQSVACPALPYFFTFHTQYDFWKKKLWIKNMYFVFLYKFYLKKILILRRIKRYIIINVHSYSCKVPNIFSDFKENWIFSTDFRKVFKYQISRKSVSWESSCFMCSAGRTDRHDEANSRFSQFCDLAWKLILRRCLVKCWNPVPCCPLVSGRVPEA